MSFALLSGSFTSFRTILGHKNNTQDLPACLLLNLITFGTTSYITAIRTGSPAPMLAVVVAAFFLFEEHLPDPRYKPHTITFFHLRRRNL
jgi:hypothetical protein